MFLFLLALSAGCSNSHITSAGVHTRVCYLSASPLHGVRNAAWPKSQVVSIPAGSGCCLSRVLCQTLGSGSAAGDWGPAGLVCTSGWVGDLILLGYHHRAGVPHSLGLVVVSYGVACDGGN